MTFQKVQTRDKQIRDVVSILRLSDMTKNSMNLAFEGTGNNRTTFKVRLMIRHNQTSVKRNTDETEDHVQKPGMFKPHPGSVCLSVSVSLCLSVFRSVCLSVCLLIFTSYKYLCSVANAFITNIYFQAVVFFQFCVFCKLKFNVA